MRENANAEVMNKIFLIKIKNITKNLLPSHHTSTKSKIAESMKFSKKILETKVNKNNFIKKKDINQQIIYLKIKRR